VNFHKFHALFSTTLSQLAEAIKSFAQDVFRKCSRVGTKHRKWLRLLLRILERYHKDCDEFLIHIVRITGDETWVSFLNVETKEQSKQWTHTHSPNTPKNLNTVCQKAGDNCFLRQEGSSGGGINATMNHNNVSNVLQSNHKEKLRRVIQNYMRGMLTSGVVFLHENARPHTAAPIRAFKLGVV
jgi:hypothetical protein